MTLVFRVWLSLALAACRAPGGDEPSDARPVDAGADAAEVDDGTPIRLPCTNNFGSALTTTYGRLDGILVAIVPPGTSGCNADADHLHLQIRADGAIYDVSVNIESDVLTTKRDTVASSVAWDEGWRTGLGFTYPGIGVHSGDFTATTTAQLVSELTAELATVNHISVFGTGYNAGGTHLIHRNNGFDGALVTKPLSNPPRVRMFRFANQTF